MEVMRATDLPELGIRVEGVVYDGAGEPVPDALLEVFDGDQFARCRTDSEGAFAFAVRDTHHLEVLIFARGLLRHLATRMYFPGADTDALLESIEPERRHTLIAVPSEGGLRFDIRLQGEDETVFFQV